MDLSTHNLCRLCLTPSPVQRALFNTNESIMLEALTGIEVTEEDFIPKKACVKCLLNLKFAFQIQQKFLHSYKWLTENSTEVGEIKPDIALNKENEEKEIDIINSVEAKDVITKKTTLDKGIKVEDESSNDASLLNHPQLDETEEIAETNNKASVSSLFDTVNLGNCVVCGTKDATRKHVRRHYEARYRCEHCYVFLGNIKEYSKHMTDNHKQIDMVCPTCGLSFRYACLFNLHRANAHEKPKRGLKKKSEQVKKVTNSEMHKVHDCKDCGKCFMTEAKFLTHLRIHQRVKCPICQKEVGRQNYYTHYKMHSASQLICHLCGAVVKNISSFRGHMYYTHSQKSLPCEHCGKVFKKKYNLLLHIKKEHTGERNHVCDICGKRFVTRYRLTKHMEMKHLKLRKHVCRFCEKGLSSKHALKTHERQHTNDNPYKCEVCGEGFRQNVSLRWHRKSKHNIVEEKKVECKECGKKFQTEWAVKSHARIHM
nr:unnamed protein product [Callosobruchus analis]